MRLYPHQPNTILDNQEKIMINKVNHDLAYALAEFATHVIDRYDSDDP